LLLHVHAAVPPRERRDAAPLLQLPGAVPVAERDVLGGGDDPGAGARDHRLLPPGGAQVGAEGFRQPVGARGLRVAHRLAADQAQLRGRARPPARRVRLPGAGGLMPVLHEQYEDLAKQEASARLGMWAFLASESLLFAGLFGLYV